MIIPLYPYNPYKTLTELQKHIEQIWNLSLYRHFQSKRSVNLDYAALAVSLYRGIRHVLSWSRRGNSRNETHKRQSAYSCRRRVLAVCRQGRRSFVFPGQMKKPTMHSCMRSVHRAADDAACGCTPSRPTPHRPPRRLSKLFIAVLRTLYSKRGLEYTARLEKCAASVL